MEIKDKLIEGYEWFEMSNRENNNKRHVALANAKHELQKSVMFRSWNVPIHEPTIKHSYRIYKKYEEIINGICKHVDEAMTEAYDMVDEEEELRKIKEDVK